MKRFFQILTIDLFLFSFSTYFFLFTLEIIKKGFVSHLFNLDYLLLIVVSSGLLTVALGGSLKFLLKSNLVFGNPVYFSWAGGLLLFLAIKDLGLLALIISLLTSLIFYYLIKLILNLPGQK